MATGKGFAQPELVFREMIDAFAANDIPAIAARLAEDVVGFVTNAQVAPTASPAAYVYLARLPDVSEADYEIAVTQSVCVAPSQVLAMVEIKAKRKDRILHNHAAFLARIEGDQVTEIWMVDALPAYSDEFWS